MKRTVTFVLQFDDKDAPNWLWDAHLQTINGIDTVSIYEGNAIKELLQLSQLVDDKDQIPW